MKFFIRTFVVAASLTSTLSFSLALTSTSSIPTKQVTSPIHILIVPGHEPGYGGAEYRDLKERDMTFDLASYLYEFLRKSPEYDIHVTRNRYGWNPEFDQYFATEGESTTEFVQNKKAEMVSRFSDGSMIKVTDGVTHNDAPAPVAWRLYAINKWADEHNINLAIHIHFNDEVKHADGEPGQYSGFAIYMPDKQYGNASTSRDLARHLMYRLSSFSPMSNFPKEDKGILEDQDLIAIGAQNTSNYMSVLIEYGYIYEEKLANPATRQAALREMAYQTYLGLEDFYHKKSSIEGRYATTLLPHTWNVSYKKSQKPKVGIMALQKALTREGVYPPLGVSVNDCPISGVFGPCTKRALATFQANNNISGSGNILDQTTRARLNALYNK
jgi:N-acetylmuramoyl-L-alanine amidase